MKVKNKHICMVAPFPVDKRNIQGGVESVTVYLLEALGEITYLNISVISCRKDINKESIKKFGNITVYYIPSAKRFGNITLNFMDKVNIHKKINMLNPDIVHFQETAFAYKWIHAQCPTILTIHGVKKKEMQLKKGIKNRVRFFPLYLNELLAWKCVKNTISISPYIRTKVSPFAKNVKFYDIENPISQKFFEIESSEDPFSLLFVGFVMKLKNVFSLVQAVNLLKNSIPQITLRIAGGVTELKYYELIKEYIEKHNLEKYIHFLGHLGEEDILEEYKRASIILLSSYQETAPMVIQQAMAAGKPVIGSIVGGIPCLIKDNHTGFLVEPDDIATIADKIKKLVLNDSLRKNFGKRARQEALSRFTSKAVAKKTVEAYFEILEHG